MDNETNYILIRRAHIIDCEKIFELSNDPIVRKLSYQQKPIEFDDHVHWFVKKLYDENFLLLVAFSELHNFIGQIKFELNKEKAIIGISITEKFRGKGIAKKLLELSHNFLKKTRPEIIQIFAYIKKENIASNKLFKHFGYKKIRDVKINNIASIEYIYKLKGK